MSSSKPDLTRRDVAIHMHSHLDFQVRIRTEHKLGIDFRFMYYNTSYVSSRDIVTTVLSVRLKLWSSSRSRERRQCDRIATPSRTTDRDTIHALQMPKSRVATSLST